MSGGHPMDDLRVADARTFLVVAGTGAVSAAARELRVTPSQVSKSLARLESRVGARLLARSARGVALTHDGRRVLPLVEELVARADGLRREARGAQAVRLTLAGASYQILALLPVVARGCRGVRFRGLELPPALLRAHLTDNIYDVAFLVGASTAPLPPSWTAEEVGVLRKGVFAPPRVARALGARPVRPEVLLEHPWVAPIYHVGGRFHAADDDCPLSGATRTFGHETQTAIAALATAAATDHLVFGPHIAAASFLQRGELTAVEVRGWDIAEPLYVAVHVERVRDRTRAEIAAAVRGFIAEHG